MSTTTTAIDEQRLEEFMHRFVGDLGAAMSAALVVIGDRLGLYRAMGDCEPVNAETLARRTQTDERYVREWLSNQAAGGYVSFDPDRNEFFLTPEQSFALAQDGSPAFIPGAFQAASAMVKATDKITSAFEHGHGVGWDEHDQDLYCGTERFFRPGYTAHLVSSWIPALDGVQAKLEAGARVADVGCGHGASTILMAQAFPPVAIHGIRLPRAVDRARAARGRGGGRGRPRQLRGRLGQGVPARHRRGYDAGDDVRLPARHGRSGRRVGARARDACRGRHVDARRAQRRRPPARTTSTRSAACSTPPRRSSARPRRARRRSGWRSAPRRASGACARSSRQAASPASAARPRRRSTSSSKPALDDRPPYRGRFTRYGAQLRTAAGLDRAIRLRGGEHRSSRSRLCRSSRRRDRGLRAVHSRRRRAATWDSRRRR